MNQFQHLKTEYEQILDQLSNTIDPKTLAELGRKRAELLPMVEKIRRLDRLNADIEEHEKLAGEKNELGEMALAELPALKSEKEKVEQEITKALLPKDPYDGKNVIVEIRAGA